MSNTSKMPNGIPINGMNQGKTLSAPVIAYASTPSTPSIVPLVIHASIEMKAIKMNNDAIQELIFFNICFTPLFLLLLQAIPLFVPKERVN